MSTSFATDSDDVRLERDVSWEAFASFLVARGEKPPRVAYLEGTLETMSPSPTHELWCKNIATMVEAYLDHIGIQYRGLRAWLLRSAPGLAGVEPDECYVFGYTPKPRPDLAIEVVWSSGSLDKLEIYRRLGVPEVWYCRRDAIEAYVLVDDRYERRTNSECLPGFDFGYAIRLSDNEHLSELRRLLRDRMPPRHP
ncbi:MAG TPA: Uma2 family endonuclease [Kofleriaceae bacterium]